MESPSSTNATVQKQTMKAVVQKGYGAPERVLKLEEVDRPSVGDDDVLIRVRATSVNTPDWITVAGVPYILRLKSGLRKPSTPVRGTDVAGVVEAVGKNVTDLQPGDEVFGSSWADTLANRAGAFAEFTVAPASQLIKKPVGLTFEEAAASVMSGLTALIAMRDVGKVGPGSKVLINGASGGVGTFAVQIAKTLGAEVTGVCSTGNLELVRSLGADHVIDYTEEDFTRSEQRYDVILDNVINRPPSATARVLAPTGMLIPNSIGNTGGFFAGLPRAARAALMGLGSTDVQFVKGWVVNRENLDALTALLESGDVKVVIDKIYPLSEAANAVAHMLGHHARGKVVIVGVSEAMPGAAGGVALRDVSESDLLPFFEDQMDADATHMAAFPSRDRDPHMAHWHKLMSDESVVTRTVLFNGRVAGNIVSWKQAGERRVGYWIGKSHWGKGVTTAALSQFLTVVTTRPLYAYVAKHNVGSIRVLEKCGFTVEHEYPGADVDEVVLRNDS